MPEESSAGPGSTSLQAGASEMLLPRSFGILVVHVLYVMRYEGKAGLYKVVLGPLQCRI